jgi:peptidoglycan/LPS O-acetylase OafA/YrhL
MTANAIAPQKLISGHVLRPEIQGLRALAVAVVVIYHIWPGLVPGGYVGVDVFFVISGFLITAHICRGVLAEPRFSLATFYARRIRRLLPASLFVLLVSAIATLVWLPATMWNAVGRQLLASVFYVQNWVLAADSVDYLAADTAGSPLQHFWSLAVEEQFYLVWPVLLLLAGLVTLRGRSRQTSLVAVVGLVTVASFVVALIATSSSPADAYFITPTRVWEFGVGGLCSFIVLRSGFSPRARSLVSWLGLAAIAAAAWLYTSDTPFPGTAALLPVLGTAAVILAGNVPVAWSPGALLNRRVVQYLGGISYSLYLWHWPLLIFFPFVIAGGPQDLTVVQGLLVLALSLVLAHLSKRFIEDPFRGSPVSRSRLTVLLSRRRGVYAAAVIGMLAVGSVAAVPLVVSEVRINAAHAAVAAEERCLGAQAMDPALTSDCEGFEYSGAITPDPLVATPVYQKGCQQLAEKVEAISCTLGSDDPTAPVVVVAGDSHANHWLAAIDQVAEDQGWQVRTFFKGGCPFSAAPMRLDDCGVWNDGVSAEIGALDPEIVFTSAVAGIGPVGGKSVDRFANAVQGYVEAWRPILDRDIPIVAFADIPSAVGAGLEDPPTCVLTGETACEFDRSAALMDDGMVIAGASLRGVNVVDLNDYFCTGDTCHSVIGNVLAYADGNHMTSVYAQTLAPAVAAQLEELGLATAAEG